MAAPDQDRKKRRARLGGLIKSAAPLAGASFSLFLIDSFANLVDYGYHFYLGRRLSLGEFAVFQTLNTVLLVLATIFGVLQPLIARFTAASEVPGTPGPSTRSRSFFQTYFWTGLVLGVVLWAATWIFRAEIGAALNVPGSAVAIFSILVPFSLLRPVFAGALQGFQRFWAFGFVRTMFAVVRFAAAGMLLALGWGLAGAVASLPIGALAAVLFGAAVLGKAIWRPAERISPQERQEGTRLSIAALVAFSAFILMMNLDLIWVNRTFSPEDSGVYATAVLLRRALFLFPGAVSIVIYPRAVAALARGRLPDRPLMGGAAVIAAAIAALTLVYAAAGRPLISLTFGEAYAGASEYLGLLGAAMVGFGLASLWMHFFIGSRPWPYVALLCAGLAAQVLFYLGWARSIGDIIWVFLVSGWTVALGGFALYFLWFRRGRGSAKENPHHA